MDRSNLANARLGGLEEDLGMSGTNFNFATSILFIGYILGQLPANLSTSALWKSYSTADNLFIVITRVRPSVFLGLVMAVWGLLTTLTSQADTYQHLLVIRFFLGVVSTFSCVGACS